MSNQNSLVIRYGELGLKGGNRNTFEHALCDNLKVALKDVPGFKTSRQRGRITCNADIDLAPFAERASKVFGITSVSPATTTYLDADLIVARTIECVSEALINDFAGRDEVSFRITVKRANKQFPLRSRELTQKIAEAILPLHPQLKVDLQNAELNLEVDIREELASVFARRHKGYGGLPVGSMGRGMCLLSGGIDSPVAAWMCMKRGMRMEFISFYSFPHVGPQTREKIIRLAEKVGEYQPRTILHMIPFAPYQEAIRDNCPASYRTVLYRRAMQRIATAMAKRNRCKALITGESLGQVASQTMQNIAAIEDASGLPVLRPLIGMDKTEAIELAKRIGTFELSTQPVPDCCTVFQPESPVIHGSAAEAQLAEADLDISNLTYAAVTGAEKLEFPERS